MMKVLFPVRVLFVSLCVECIWFLSTPMGLVRESVIP